MRVCTATFAVVRKPKAKGQTKAAETEKEMSMPTLTARP